MGGGGGSFRETPPLDVNWPRFVIRLFSGSATVFTVLPVKVVAVMIVPVFCVTARVTLPAAPMFTVPPTPDAVRFASATVVALVTLIAGPANVEVKVPVPRFSTPPAPLRVIVPVPELTVAARVVVAFDSDMAWLVGVTAPSIDTPACASAVKPPPQLQVSPPLPSVSEPVLEKVVLPVVIELPVPRRAMAYAAEFVVRALTVSASLKVSEPADLLIASVCAPLTVLLSVKAPAPATVPVPMVSATVPFTWEVPVPESVPPSIETLLPIVVAFTSKVAPTGRLIVPA